MAAKVSSGLLVFRHVNALEVLLVHPGGPYWAKKDEGAWFIVKGEVEEGEELLRTAQREFAEEVGQPAPGGSYLELGTTKHKSGKLVHAWGVEADLDLSSLRSNTFSIEWPPRSGRQQEFPEVSRARYCAITDARRLMHPGEWCFVERLIELVPTAYRVT